jgi:hypothetical protein
VTNQLANPSVEDTDVSMYSAVGSSTFTRAAPSSGPAPDGLFIAQVLSGATGNMNLNTATVPANPGEVWSAGVMARFLAGTARLIRVDIQWIDAGAAVISTALGTGVPVNATTFTAYKNEGATAPALTVGVRIRLVYISTVSGDSYEADAFQLEQGATLPVFNPLAAYNALLDESGSGAILLEDGTPILI